MVRGIGTTYISTVTDLCAYFMCVVCMWGVCGQCVCGGGGGGVQCMHGKCVILIN